MLFRTPAASILQTVKAGQAVRFKPMQMSGATRLTAIQLK